MEAFNRPAPRPEFVERKGEFPGGLGTYQEKRWIGLIEGDIPFQVDRTCVPQVVARVVETRYIVYCYRKNIPVPFSRLSVQYVIDRSTSRRYQHLETSKTRCMEVARDGILAVEHYCESGLRGERNWIPNRLIPHSRIPRYPAQGNTLIMYGNIENYKTVQAALKDGPVYVDFLIENDYANNPGRAIPHRSRRIESRGHHDRKLDSHAVCAVGYGAHKPVDGKVKYYLLYLNSYSVHWGDNGYGRIEWDCLSSAWIPTVPDEIPPPQPLSSSPPRQSLPPFPPEERKKTDDLKRKRATGSGGSGGGS